MELQKVVDFAQSAANVKFSPDNYGGRKFVAFLFAEILLAFIFIVMLIFKWLDGGMCMQFVTFIVGVYGGYIGVNQLEKYIVTKKQNGGKPNDTITDGGKPS